MATTVSTERISLITERLTIFNQTTTTLEQPRYADSIAKKKNNVSDTSLVGDFQWAGTGSTANILSLDTEAMR